MHPIATTALAIMLALPILPAAAAPADTLGGELATARTELQSEMAKARRELATSSLQLGKDIGISIGKRSQRQDDDPLPPAEITAGGQLVIDGKPVITTAAQRTLLLDYRKQLISVAMAGIDVGERAANLALKSIDTSLISLLASAMSGRLEKRLERDLKREIAPMAMAICDHLPATLAAEQRLSAELPSFSPYAYLQESDITTCHSEVTNSLSMR